MDATELRTLLVESQTATHASILHLGETLTSRLDALTTTITALVEQNQREPRAPPPLHQQQLPQYFPPLPHQDQRQQQRHQQQFPAEEDEADQHRRVFLDDMRRNNYDHRWENSFKVDIPEFHGGLKGDDLIDWMIAVEEILEFKQVPPARRVSLVAMRFSGHAATWWKQLKTTRSQTGKPPIQSWEKLTKHLRQTFLPHNYERTMYTRLQNLRQGNHNVDEYAEEFSLLLTRNELNDVKFNSCHDS